MRQGFKPLSDCRNLANLGLSDYCRNMANLGLWKYPTVSARQLADALR
ncbi:hypothetical protein QUB63_34675 [Microcoleus sp. ARI1-B5]